jgi:AAA domain-containing protein
MRLAHITIDNLAGLTFEATLPAIALIQGHNGAGKTSLKQVITYAFGRSIDGSRAVHHDPKMVLTGEKGEATITFDDGNMLRVAVTKDSTRRMTKPKDGKRWSNTGSEIDALANAISYDPILIRSMTEARRVETLLRICPVQVTVEEIQEAIGNIGVGAPHEPSLEAINAYHEDIYALRRTENVSADTQKKHAEELAAALPQAIEHTGLSASELRAQKEALDAELNKFIDTCKRAMTALEREQNSSHAARCVEIDNEINAKIAILERERVTRREASAAILNEVMTKARAEGNAVVSAKRLEVTPERERLVGAITEAEVMATALAQAEGGRQALDRALRSAETHRERAAQMTAALDRLKALKETVAGRMAIKGITIASPGEGLPVDICREEKGVLVPFSVWNHTSQLLFCLRIAVLSHGACGLVCLDSIDAVDAETRAAMLSKMRDYATSAGLQFLLGEVADGPLRVVDADAAEVGTAAP